jgi:hypothetical protein
MVLGCGRIGQLLAEGLVPESVVHRAVQRLPSDSHMGSHFMLRLSIYDFWRRPGRR